MIQWSDDPEAATRLHNDDARALDALIEAGLDPGAVPPEFRDRAGRIGALLGLLETPVEAGPGAAVLADRVMEGVRESRRARPGALSARDSEALEACVMKRFEVSKVPGPLRERARRHESLRRAVTTLGPSNESWIRDGREARTEAVMRAVSSADTAPIPFESPQGRRGFRFSDLVAAAAVLLVGSAVVLPVSNSFTESGRRAVCMDHLRTAGMGLGMYAFSNDDALPMATAGFGGSWSQVGKPGRSHSANLYTLVRTKHVNYWDLVCPGNEAAPSEPLGEDALDWRSIDEVSYSYRLMPRGEHRLDALEGDSVVLADRSPMLLAGLRGLRVSPEAASPNHLSDGQHLLHVDQAVRWTGSPVLESGDNIWLPRHVEEMVQQVRAKYGLLEGRELPSSTEDTFLGP